MLPLLKIYVAKDDKERATKVAEQLREQRRLSQLCGRQFSTLSQGISFAERQCSIDNAYCERLHKVNRRANQAKHDFSETTRSSQKRKKNGDDGFCNQSLALSWHGAKPHSCILSFPECRLAAKTCKDQAKASADASKQCKVKADGQCFSCQICSR